MNRQSGKSSLGKFEITSHLFTLIDGLSAEKQFILLKQLLGPGLPVHLMRLVLDLTETERVELLKSLDESPDKKEQITTISLDDASDVMRGHLRRTCRIPVSLGTAENTHQCTIVDISTFGVFIQSHVRHANGKNIQLTFTLPGSETALSIEGTIVRSTPAGVGVRFQNLSASQFEVIRTFCQE